MFDEMTEGRLLLFVVLSETRSSRARVTTTRLSRTANLSFAWLRLLQFHGCLPPREDP